MVDSGYGRALGVLGALRADAAAGVLDEDSDDCAGAFAAIEAHGAQASASGSASGMDRAFAVLADMPLSRAQCCKLARNSRGKVAGIPKHVRRKVERYNAEIACRNGDRSDLRPTTLKLTHPRPK